MMTKINKRFRHLLAMALMGSACMVVSVGHAGNIISAGGAIDDTNGSIQVVGQTAIGVVADADIRMFIGGLYTLSEVSCLVGDVDLNGIIDGRDIDEYILVVVDGGGNAQQMCAANIEVADFATLLLAQ